jgi:hypothetical protein
MQNATYFEEGNKIRYKTFTLFASLERMCKLKAQLDFVSRKRRCDFFISALELVTTPAVNVPEQLHSVLQVL